ncbi:MAG: hypothetical protein ACXV95_07040 [Acidimicrobiales bacterium]
MNGAWTVVTHQPMERFGGVVSNDVSCPTTTFCLGLASDRRFNDDYNIQYWDGTSWVFDGNGGSANPVFQAECYSPTVCWIWLQDKGRNFFAATESGGRPAPWPPRVSYDELGFPDPPAMSCSPTGCVFLGDGTTTWDGSQYHVQIATGPTPAVKALSCISPASCVGTGFLDASTGTTPAYRWDGISWVDLPPLDPPAGETFEPLDLSCADPGGCVAVGAIADVSTGDHHPASAHWDGSTWSLTPLPVGGLGELVSVSCANGVECLAVGSVEATVGAPVDPVAVAWNGERWYKAARPPGSDLASYTAVSCVRGSHWCMAVGADGPPDETQELATAVYTWND